MKTLRRSPRTHGMGVSSAAAVSIIDCIKRLLIFISMVLSARHLALDAKMPSQCGAIAAKRCKFEKNCSQIGIN